MVVDPKLILEYVVPVLENVTEQTVELVWLEGLSSEFVNSYLERLAPHMQSTYRHMLALNENVITTKLQKELVQVYLSERLPTNALYEEHALLLGKIQQHQLALTLYVCHLHKPELAQAYCERIFHEKASSPNMYLTILPIYLNTKGITSTMLDEALDLLGKRWNMIDGA
ncbi:hypothetical protein AMTR_s00046p00206740 [Amborella trichopoda]|uniref:Vacuolar sorting protein 39/Transforming growth factor beta receptor-associated domain-containing protein n=1 Tax=Amborella trichopoda TaxID=13333 RepID=U5D6J6_AMBTC|nr:hypothetical protein AMTR_s00046p00206740 [Amborella trichopoda]